MAYLKNVVLLSLSLPLLTSAWHHPGSRHDRWPQQPEDAPITSTIEVFLPDETPTISVPSTSPLAEEIPLDKSTTLAQASSVPQPISAAVSGGYKKLATYDASNWFTSFDYQDGPDPTKGTVDYISLDEAKSSGLTKIVGNQVFMGVDNTTVIPASSDAGRKSIWITSKEEFKYGLLIGDFAHMPSSTCGLWPAFWTINKDTPGYGEIDIVESYSTLTNSFMTLHTQGECSFVPPTNANDKIQTGEPSEHGTNCQLDTGNGCSVVGPEGAYGDPFNAQGGGVYAMEWNEDFIRIYYFPRNAIPADIKADTPDPSKWGLPSASFEKQHGGCDIASNFPAQTIYFDTTFCGAEAGGQAWIGYGGQDACQKSTGVSTCEEFVRTHPEVYDEAYWLVNSVKVFQK